MSVWKRLFGKREAKAPRTKPGQRLYAIGDIHGRDDLLAPLLSQIIDDAAATPQADIQLIFLGDYVDRGPESRAVIERILQFSDDRFCKICLKGNHEDMMVKFLEDPTVGPLWAQNGGDETLRSYGVIAPGAMAGETQFDEARRDLDFRMPDSHKEFLQNLMLSYAAGDYFFVHAGIRPALPFSEQDEEDLLWIREPFLENERPLEKIVVHGHSVSFEPEIRPNRICVDTGAFMTDRLTCAVLDGEEIQFLQTSGGD